MGTSLLQFVSVWWWMPLLWIATFVGGLLLMEWLILRIPPDYFVRPPRSLRYLSRPQRIGQLALMTLKNGGGLVLLAAGLLMLFTPGPGLLAMVLGLSLVNFPGKRTLEVRLLCQPRVLDAANRLRRRRGIAPLISPENLLASKDLAGYSLNNTRD